MMEKISNQKGNASVLIIFVLIVIFSIYLAGGPSLLLSGESPKPEVPISGSPGGEVVQPTSPLATPTISPSVSPSPTTTTAPTP